MTSSPCEARPAAVTFDEKLAEHGRFPLRAVAVDTLQVNLGKLCNQVCKHCHVDAGPHRVDELDNMSAGIIDLVIDVVRRHRIPCLDITGGAPELNPGFRRLVRAAREAGARVMDRCNLTILLQPGQEDLARFLAEYRVEVVASLPYWGKDRTDAQRGTGVFESSILALRRLNALGYGDGRSGLRLCLVYNPVGIYFPPDQQELERDYKRELQGRFQVKFDQLFTITNMPISRFLSFLRKSGNEEEYRTRLLQAFNPSAADGVMCRSLLSVGPDGSLYDCDFNQMLEMKVGFGAAPHLRDFDPARLAARRIVTDRHCFGCTAGAGSSCGGSTA